MTLLAWHTSARDPRVETWHAGRFLEMWASPPEIAELAAACAGYDAPDVTRALDATADLFERLERELAERLRLAVPVRHDELRALLRRILLHAA